jgi:ankyrin repeat protein
MGQLGQNVRGRLHFGMSAEAFLVSAMRAVGRRDTQVIEHMLNTRPDLVDVRIKRDEECFLDDCGAQVYEGDTLLHAASFTHNTALARRLVDSGADVRARNRRGAEPLHAATNGGPGSKPWNPSHQTELIAYRFIERFETDAQRQ